ncbi:alpha/beta hydrolase [Actinoallomurus sp. CA-142502]|uniref:alpha/beta hydrolase n=1 Tax=Actinoallomurus sp. CA-142502 TaxID=3239885 RepID=UPI003D8E8267
MIATVLRVTGPLAAGLLLVGCTGDGAHPAQPPAPAPTTSQASVPTQAARFRIARRTSAGPILVTSLKGAKSGMTGKVWVWLPPQYRDPAYAKTRFPVLMLYPGGSGAGYNYWTDPKVEPIQEEDMLLARQGRAHPFIMVMPIMQPSTREDTECSDIPGHVRIGTWLADDVPALVRASFHTLTSRNGWGTVGASSGAFCAVKMAAERSGTYTAAVSWGGYFTPDTTLSWSQRDRQANRPDLILQRTRPDLRLFLLAGGDPKIHADVVRIEALTKTLRPPTAVTTYIQPHGLHQTSDLKKLLPAILEFLTRNLAGPSSR